MALRHRKPLEFSNLGVTQPGFSHNEFKLHFSEYVVYDFFIYIKFYISLSKSSDRLFISLVKEIKLYREEISSSDINSFFLFLFPSISF